MQESCLLASGSLTLEVKAQDCCFIVNASRVRIDAMANDGTFIQ